MVQPLFAWYIMFGAPYDLNALSADWREFPVKKKHKKDLAVWS